MEKARTVNEPVNGLPVLNCHVAGMDAGSAEMRVTCTSMEKQTCRFMTECHTESLEEPVNHLLSEDVTDVAMESTGICGEPLRAKPEKAGIRVAAINPSLYKKPDIGTDGRDSGRPHQYYSVDLFRKLHIATESWLEYDESFYGEERKKQQIKEEARLHCMARKSGYMPVKIA